MFDPTMKIYREAVEYLTEIALIHYEDMVPMTGYLTEGGTQVTAQQQRQQYMERLVHNTKKNKAVYQKFDRNFYKFPSYFRRDAINAAVGDVFSYQSLVANWEKNGKQGKKPFFKRNRNSMPCFYRGNTYLQEGRSVKLKLYDGHDWVWKTVMVRNTDWRYIQKNMACWDQNAPVLVKRGHRYELQVAFVLANKNLPKFKKDKDVESVLGVDLGLNTDAVCSVVEADGTVIGQRFINSPVEKDRMYGLLNAVKKAQQHGNYRPRRLWRFVNNYNTAVAEKTASDIVKFAVNQLGN